MQIEGKNTDLCVVIPVCNEEESIVAVFEELCTVIVAVSKLKRVRLLVVDDFSQDNGIELLKQWYCKQQLHGFSLTVIRLKHRHGMGNALTKGFKLAATWSPYLTLVMDADGQHDPACVPELVERAKTVDMVCTQRGKIGGSLFFRFCHKSFLNLIKCVAGKSIHTGSFCLIRLPVLKYLAGANYIDYLAAFLNVVPFSCHKLTVERRDRIAGKSKFGFFGYAYTAAVIMSYYPRFLTSLHYTTILFLIVVSNIDIITESSAATILFALFVIIIQFWCILLIKIVFKRSLPSRSVIEDTVEQVE